MDIGYIVGITVAIALIISGVITIILAKKNDKRNKWAVWLIIIGIVALTSAAINYNFFNHS